MTTYEDNQVITLEELNNTAIDLGATDFSAFDTETFGVDKLNEITSSIVGKGVLTTYDKCKTVITNGKLYIRKGVIVFESGAKIRITEPVEVNATVGDYIYAYNDTGVGKAFISTSSELPEQGDYVVLAKMSDDGASVADLREMSVAKIAISSSLQNNYVEQSVNLQLSSREESTAVLPNMPQCKYIKLVNYNGKTERDYVGYGGAIFAAPELTEEYQDLFKLTPSGETMSVKKVNGSLFFRYYINRGGFNGSITFVLM